MAWIVGVVWALAAGLSFADTPGQAPPLFDAHIHYNQAEWAGLPPAAAIDRLDRARIAKAFVSSTPTAGTERLFAISPDRVVPLLRPYRTRADRRTWYQDAALIQRLERHLADLPYRGIGEFHVFGEQASTPVMRQLIALAAERGLFLHAHADRDAIGRILAQAQRTTVIWAHAGFDIPVSELAALLDQHANLMLELSYRSDIAPDGRLADAWRALFVAHPTRFLIGMDTHVEDRWADLPALADETRHWLGQLPAAVADRIAFGNAAALADGS